MDNPVGLRGLLDVTVKRIRSTAGDYDTVDRQTSFIVDVAELERRARTLTEDSDDLGKHLAFKFLDALTTRRTEEREMGV
jgi:hypothetical protein